MIYLFYNANTTENNCPINLHNSDINQDDLLIYK